MIIQFAEPINVSVQVGDLAWYVDTTPLGVSGNMYDTANGDNMKQIGYITSITQNTITIDFVINTPLGNSFIMFSKDNRVNKGSLLGYYAKIRMINRSKEKIELFSVGSEISESSK